MSDERDDHKKSPVAGAATSRRAALKRIAELGALVSAPAAFLGCSGDAPYSSTSYTSCQGPGLCYYSGGGYSSGAYSSGGYSSGGYSSSSYSSSSYSSSSYSSSYSSQYCSGYGSLYYYSYRCTYS